MNGAIYMRIHINAIQHTPKDYCVLHTSLCMVELARTTAIPSGPTGSGTYLTVKKKGGEREGGGGGGREKGRE